MKKNLGIGVALLVLAAAGAWWWVRRPAAPRTEAFARLPGGFAVAWQADWASLRRSPLVRQAQERASRLPVDPAHLARLRQADWISGVVLPGGRSVIAMEGPQLSFVSAAEAPAGSGSAARQLADLEPLPKGHDFWLVIDPRSAGPLTIGPVQGVTLQLPSDLVTSARRISAYGKVGALSLEFAAEAEYPQPEDAARLTSSLNGFLGLLRKVALRGRNDEALKLLWESLEVKTEGNRLLLRVRLDEMSLARLLLLAGP